MDHIKKLVTLFLIVIIALSNISCSKKANNFVLPKGIIVAIQGRYPNNEKYLLCLVKNKKLIKLVESKNKLSTDFINKSEFLVRVFDAGNTRIGSVHLADYKGRLIKKIADHTDNYQYSNGILYYSQKTENSLDSGSSSIFKKNLKTDIVEQLTFVPKNIKPKVESGELSGGDQLGNISFYNKFLTYQTSWYHPDPEKEDGGISSEKIIGVFEIDLNGNNKKKIPSKLLGIASHFGDKVLVNITNGFIVYDYKTSKQIHRYRNSRIGGSVRAWSPDDKYVLSWNGQDMYKINLKSGKTLKILELDQNKQEVISINWY